MLGLFAVLVIISDIIAVCDCLQNDFDLKKRLRWMAIVVIIPVAGMIMYFLFGKKSVHTS